MRLTRLTGLLLAAALVLGLGEAAAFHWLGLGGAPADARTAGGSVESYGVASARGPAPNLVDEADLQAAGQGTPGRALLHWWREAQFGAPAPRLAQDVDPSAHLDLPRFTREVALVRYVFDEAKPALVDAHLTGRSAEVTTVLVHVRAPGEPGPDQTQAPQAFTLVRGRDGAWRIADTSWLDTRYQAEIQYAQAERAKAAKRAGARGR